MATVDFSYLTSDDFAIDLRVGKEVGFADAMRAVAKFYGYEAGTVTVNGSGAGSIDVRVQDEAKSDEPVQSEFGKRATSLLREAADVYQQRNAVYKDNFRVVGRVMEALFPNGAPRLHDAEDFNRWHIFELLIVKLTRYVANWDEPDEDSLVDMIPYLAILGVQDEDLREAIKAQQDLERRAEHIGSVVSARRSDPTAPNYEADV